MSSSSSQVQLIGIAGAAGRSGGIGRKVTELLLTQGKPVRDGAN